MAMPEESLTIALETTFRKDRRLNYLTKKDKLLVWTSCKGNYTVEDFQETCQFLSLKMFSDFIIILINGRSRYKSCFSRHEKNNEGMQRYAKQKANVCLCLTIGSKLFLPI